MRVYVESNFVLEIALDQDEADSCREILALAEAGRIELWLPAYTFAEGYEVLLRRRGEREILKRKIDAEFRQLRRTRSYRQTAGAAEDLLALLIRSGEESVNRFEDALRDISKAGNLIPLSAPVLLAGLEFQTSRSLEPQDAIIYASVVDDLIATAAEPSVFISRNPKDFLTPDIQNELARYQCLAISRFSDGLDFVRAHVHDR